MSKSEHRRLCSRKHERNSHERHLSELCNRLSTPLTWIDIHKFLTQICPYELDAFAIPQIGDGFVFVGKDGNAIQPDYLFDQWYRGCTPVGYAEQTKHRLWTLTYPERMAQLREWEEASVHPFGRVLSITSSTFAAALRKSITCMARLIRLV